MFSAVADNDTAEYISKALGNRTVVYRTETESVNHSSGGGRGNASSYEGGWFGAHTGDNRNTHQNWQQGRGSGVNEQRASLPLLSLDQVLNLDRRNQVLMISGTRPIMSVKKPYFSDPRFEKKYKQI